MSGIERYPNAKGVSMSRENVLALLDRRKGETRRLNDVQPAQIDGLWHCLYPWGEGGHGIYDSTQEFRKEYDRLLLAHSRFKKDDFLYVRETYRVDPKHDSTKPSELPQGVGVFYDADFGEGSFSAPQGKYRHRRYMPARIARIFLKVTGVAIEQLHEITTFGAINEGIEERRWTWGDEPNTRWFKDYSTTKPNWLSSARLSYATLWNTVYPPDFAWDTNPFVTTIKFDIVGIHD